MFYSYVISILHNLRKQPVFSAIKVLSLTLGLTASVLVILHVQFVQSSNGHIENWSNTYRLLSHLKMREINQPYRTAHTSDAYGPQIALDFEEQIQHMAKIRFNGGVFSRNNESSENTFLWGDPDIVYLLDFDFIQGDPDTALVNPNTVVLSETAVQKYFPNEDPMGQLITLNEVTDLRVTGVIADQPRNATHPVEIAVGVATGRQMYGPNFMGGNFWMSFGGTQTLIALEEGVTPGWFDDNIAGLIERHMPEENRFLANDLDFTMSLQPIRDAYLNPLDNFASPENTRGRTILSGLMVFALLILGTSCINYMNLSLSQFTQRSKEIGVRKTLGANRADITIQFLLESMFLSLLALLIALPLVALAVPVYTNLTETAFVFSDVFQSVLVFAMVALILITGLIAGIFPALSMADIEITNIVKGSFTRTRIARFARAAVTSSQFTISTTLILFAIAIYVQTNFLQDMDVGFEKENLVIMDARYNPQEPDAFNYDAMRNDMLQHPGVESVAAANFYPPGGPPLSQWRLARGDPNVTTSIVWIMTSPTFIDTYGFELLAGRTFSEQFPADFSSNLGDADPEQIYGAVITDLTAQRFGIESPEAALQETLMLGEISYRIIGVIRQFKITSGMESDQRAVGIILSSHEPQWAMHIRLDPLQTSEALAHIDSTWEQHRGNIPINRSFYATALDDVIEQRHQSISMAALIASIITMIIAGLGLYALSSYSSVRRTKEVGIRKVLGANAVSIVMLLAWDFVKPVLLACLVAWPIAYLIINQFYAGFSAQAGFPLQIYVAVTAVIIFVSFLTVATQCYRTANSDPVKSLRYE